MFDQNILIRKAKTSSFYLKLLNWSLNKMIPFNKPHHFTIAEMGDYKLRTRVPYRKSNFNHIRGIHACALATVTEFTSGFLLISRLDVKKYRLIMQRLEMDYHYQGKIDAVAEFEISEQWMQQQIYEPLKNQDAVVITCNVKIHDVKGNHLTTGKIFWQIKDWAKVKTKA